jgi:Trypsin
MLDKWIPILALAGITSTACVDTPADDVATDEAALAGGSIVPIGQYQAVGHVNGNSCTGTLIADSIVLTAGHCVCNDLAPFHCKTRATFTFDQVLIPGVPWVRNDVTVQATVLVHPDYGIAGWLFHDYAALRLDQPASQITVGVTPMSVNASTLPAVGQWVNMLGYGGIETSWADCWTSVWKRIGAAALDHVVVEADDGIVLGFDDTTTHVCPGDSGGPMLDAAGQVIGVASSGDGASNSGYHATWPVPDWIASLTVADGQRFRMWDVGDGVQPAEAAYRDTAPGAIAPGWTDANDTQLVGDFMADGYQQHLMINHGAGPGRILVADYRDGVGDTELRYWESVGQSTLLDGFLDVDDLAFAGDFMGLGHDQVLFINRSGTGHHVLIADFSSGAPPVQIKYLEDYGQSRVLDGFQDAGDRAFVGDFRGLHRDQILFLNQSGTGPMVTIIDYRDGWPHARYVEDLSQPTIAPGWHDSSDRIVAGRFTSMGAPQHDQLLLLNTDGQGGRAQILNFNDGVGPAEASYVELYGQSGLLTGWMDPEDALVVGDFRGVGHDQAMFINRTTGAGAGSGRLLVADFFDGVMPAEVGYWGDLTSETALDGRLDVGDLIITGDLRGRHRAELVTIERY